jgi:hypothetical protein
MAMSNAPASTMSNAPISHDQPVARPWSTTAPACPGHLCIDTAVAYARAHAGDGAFWVVRGPDGAVTCGRNAPPCPMRLGGLAGWCD